MPLRPSLKSLELMAFMIPSFNDSLKIVFVHLYLFQRRGIKENLDQSSSDITENFLEQTGQQNNLNEDDIVVDAIDNVPVGNDREFVINPGQILGLDQAVLQSIDRCREYFLQYIRGTRK